MQIFIYIYLALHFGVIYVLASSLYPTVIKKKDYVFEVYIGKYILHYSAEIIEGDKNHVITKFFIGYIK